MNCKVSLTSRGKAYINKRRRFTKQEIEAAWNALFPNQRVIDVGNAISVSYKCQGKIFPT